MASHQTTSSPKEAPSGPGDSIFRPPRWRGFQFVLVVVASAIVVTSGPRSVAARRGQLPLPTAPAPEDEAVHHAAVVATASDPYRSQADPTEIDWYALAELDIRTGQASPALQQLIGTVVKIPGFMLPFEDEANQVTEFLLVPYVGACVHVPPPPPNQLVYVTMEGGASIPVEWWEPIWVHGVLTIDETENVYSKVSFRMEAHQISPYQW